MSSLLWERLGLVFTMYVFVHRPATTGHMTSSLLPTLCMTTINFKTRPITFGLKKIVRCLPNLKSMYSGSTVSLFAAGIAVVLAVWLVKADLN
jgi:flagellar biosynthesis protein FlhB